MPIAWLEFGPEGLLEARSRDRWDVPELYDAGLPMGVLTGHGIAASDPDLIAQVAASWLESMLPSAIRQKAELRAARQAIEVLLRVLSLRILENEDLLGRLDEKDALIAQLEGASDALVAELRRVRLDAQRARPFVKAVRVVAATITTGGTFLMGANAGFDLAVKAGVVTVAGPDTTATDEIINARDNVATVLDACDEALHHLGPDEPGADKP
jgi:hypothetical protein